MTRAPFLLAAAFALAACTFSGTGIAPFTAAPAASVAEEDLEVPYVPTPRPVVAAMLDIAGLGRDDFLIDLGSGDGRIAIMAAQRGARALGVDIDPARVAEAAMAARLAQVETRARFRRQDLFDTPIGEASVITMYLLPDVNLRLRPRLLTEARPGSRIVSHNFTLGDWRPDAEQALDASRIFMWVVPAAVGGRWILHDDRGAAMALELDQRFQEVTGTLSGGGRTVALHDVSLRGNHLRFTAGGQTYNGLVDGAEIAPEGEPVGRAGWRARRAD
jgi:SAM-dependent methyltransferase